MNGLQSILCLLDIFSLLLQLNNQLVIVPFSLVEGLLKAGIAGLYASHLLLNVLEFVQTCVKNVGKVLALVLNIFAFLLESFQGERQSSVFVVAPLVLVLNLLGLESNCLDFSCPRIVLSF